MGADLIISALVIDKDKTPDFAAGHAWVDAATNDELWAAYEEINQEPPLDENDEELVDENGELTDEAYVKIRKFTHDLVDQLEEALTGSFRTVTSIFVRGAWVYLSGGMSWGDMPTDESELMYNIGYYEGLTEAMGFESEPWPDHGQNVVCRHCGVAIYGPKDIDNGDGAVWLHVGNDAIYCNDNDGGTRAEPAEEVPA